MNSNITTVSGNIKHDEKSICSEGYFIESESGHLNSLRTSNITPADLRVMADHLEELRTKTKPQAAPSDISEQTVNPEETVLRYAGVSDIDALNDDHYQEIESVVLDNARTLMFNKCEFYQAVGLLKAGGLVGQVELLEALAESLSALEWYKKKF